MGGFLTRWQVIADLQDGHDITADVWSAFRVRSQDCGIKSSSPVLAVIVIFAAQLLARLCINLGGIAQEREHARRISNPPMAVGGKSRPVVFDTAGRGACRMWPLSDLRQLD